MGRSPRGIWLPDRYPVNVPLLPASDLGVPSNSQGELAWPDNLPLELALQVLQVPGGTRIAQGRADGSQNVYSVGGAETLPTPTQINLIPSRTDTVTFTTADFVMPAFTVAIFSLRVSAISGTTPSIQLTVQGKSTQGDYSANFGGVNPAALTSTGSQAGVMTSANTGSAVMLPPVYRIQMVITGTTPSVTYYVDLIYK